MSRAAGFALRVGTWLLIATVVFASGCAQEAAAPALIEATSAKDAETTAEPVPVPPAAEPIPAAESPEAVSAPLPVTGDGADPAALDASCTVDSDCEVKDVGNCCGYMPACVNRSAQADPAAVQRECKRTGMSSICGFQELAGCRCEANRCVGVPSASGGGDVR